MASALPHSNQVAKDSCDYLDDVDELVEGVIEPLKKSGDFRHIFKVTLATDSILSKLRNRLVPKLAGARGIVQRIPVLTALSQLEAAEVEIRRLIEHTFWTVYFSDHPVEWAAFLSGKESGIAKDIKRPISYCASREPSFYRNYALEFFDTEASGLARAATETLNAKYQLLSLTVHATSSAKGQRLRPPIVKLDEADLGKFAPQYREVCACVCIVLCAFGRARFDRFPPAYRAWFDWLIGKERTKRLRAGSFGI